MSIFNENSNKRGLVNLKINILFRLILTLYINSYSFSNNEIYSGEKLEVDHVLSSLHVIQVSSQWNKDFLEAKSKIVLNSNKVNKNKVKVIRLKPKPMSCTNKDLESQLNSMKFKLEDEEKEQVTINPSKWYNLTPENLYDKLHEFFKFNATIAKEKEYFSKETEDSIRIVSYY